MITENLSTLKIHRLTQEQYNREYEAGNIDSKAIYIIPDETDDTSMLVVTPLDMTVNETEDGFTITGRASHGAGEIFDAAQANRKVVFYIEDNYYALVHYKQEVAYFVDARVFDYDANISHCEIDSVQRFTFRSKGVGGSSEGAITQDQIDSLELIAVDDIDAICAQAAQNIDDGEVTD